MKQSLVAIGCPEERIRIQHIGIDTEKFHFKERHLPSDGKIVILFCGRFVEKKGIIYALKALNLLISKNPQIEFRVIDDGMLRNSIESFIQENNLQPYVRLLGYQSHHVFAEEFKKAHIYIQPSVTVQNGDNEGGVPTTLLEAQASISWHCICTHTTQILLDLSVVIFQMLNLSRTGQFPYRYLQN